MSAYENVVLEKLKLKGKALDVKAGGISKKKKHKKHYNHLSHVAGNDQLTGEYNGSEVDGDNLNQNDQPENDDRLTRAERCYLERWKQIELQRLAKDAKKSHRDRIQEFNQYLANLSEHYDIPKVGSG